MDEIQFTYNLDYFTKHIWIGITLFDINVNDFQLTQSSLVIVHRVMEVMQVS